MGAPQERINMDDARQEYFNFLVKLRDSGIINMWGASPYLEETFDLTHEEATEILMDWMESIG